MTRQLANFDAVDGIAIVGMAGRLPGATTLEEFWRNIAAGVESISHFPENGGEMPSGSQYVVPAKGILEDIELFDAGFFGYTPQEARLMDPQHRVFMEIGWNALENAGYDPEKFHGAIGVYAGLSLNTYLLANLQANPEILMSTGIDKDFLSTRLSYKLNLKGPSVVVQTACSTSLVAVCEACQSLLAYQCDIALAGGISATVPKVGGYWYQEGGILSPDGHCRAFDAKARGTVPGNGVGVVVLKRLRDAIDEGDRIRAVIRGFAVNNDGAVKIGYAAPSVQGQTEVIASAQALAGVEPDTITYVEAHGTGTELGDPIEVAALTQAFRAGTDKRGFCAIGSVKTNIGHLDAAAGVASLMKTVLALEHKQLPPSLHFEEPNPKIDFAASPFYVNTSLAEWKNGSAPRRAGVSSFGIGGTNAHLVLEEAPAAVESRPSCRCQMITLSARSQSGLEAQAANLLAHLNEHPNANLADVAYTLHVGRKKFPHGLVVVCRDIAEVRAALETRDSRRVLNGFHNAGERPVVFMFPGQGTQSLEMGLQLYRTEPTFQRHVDECSAILQRYLDFDIRQVLYPGPSQAAEAAERLERTMTTQAALFVVEYALARLWMSWGIKPAALIGHSVGEYVAACLSGVLSLEDALTLVGIRGKFMDASPKGGMVAISASEERVRELMRDGLWLAAVNGPVQCVVAGGEAEIAALEERLLAESVTYHRLRTAGAFHSGLMAGVASPLTQAAQRLALNRPGIPFVSNVTGTWMTDQDACDPEYWARHVQGTVKFSLALDTLLNWNDDAVYLEVGAGQTLTSLLRYQAEHRQKGGSRRVMTAASLGSAHGSLEEADVLTRAAGRLWLAGASIDWVSYYSGERRTRVELPTYPFERKRYWADPSAAGSQATEHSTQAAVRRGRAEIDDWFAIPSWKRTMVPALNSEHCTRPNRILLFLDGSRTGEALANLLERRGHDVVSVYAGTAFRPSGDRSYIIDPLSRADYGSLVSSLQSSSQMPTLILHTWVLSEDASDRSDAVAQRVQDLGFNSLLYIAQALGASGANDPMRLVVVTDGVHDVTGEGDGCPEKATVLGPCRVLPYEMPNLSCHHIDVAPNWGLGPRMIEQLVAEIESDAPDSAVVYRSIDRWVQTFEPVLTSHREDHPACLVDGGVYLITGGLGGAGMAIARYLAATINPKLVLLSRSGLPDPAVWQKHIAVHGKDDKVSRSIRAVQLLEESGAEVLVVRADVASEVQMRDAINTAQREFGRINGVFHAAGLPGGGLVQLKDAAAAAAIMRPKVGGTRVLERLLKDEDLDFMVLCSSLSGITGAMGQVDYCAANAYLDAFARYQTVRGHFTVSIDWDVWRESGMAVNANLSRDLARLREQAITEGITDAEGVEVFRRALTSHMPQLLVATSGWARRSVEDRFPTTAQKTETRRVVDVPVESRPNLATPYEAAADDAQKAICAIWQDTLSLDRVGVHDSFFELGGHSLHAIEVVAKMNAAFGTSIPVARLYEGLTPAFLAALINEQGDRDDADEPALKEDRQDRRARQKRHQERRRSARIAQGRPA